jgi:hypothetical protein
MKRLLPILVFLLGSLSVYAQNWNPFTPGVKRYFLNSNNYLRGMRIDSIVNYGSDVHYYPFHSYRSNGPELGSWLGMEVIKKSDGRFLFPNYWGDTITLKPLAVVSDTWLFFQDDGTKYYNASVTAVDTMTILGSLDSIKKIVITAFNNGQPLLTDSLNNVEVILSKTSGFYAIIDLYLFPYHQPDTNLFPQDYFFSHSLVPLQLPYVCLAGESMDTLLGAEKAVFRLIEFTNPTSASMHDWNVGDVLEYSSCFLGWGSVHGCDIPWNYSLDTIVAKNISVSGVEYITHGWRAGVDTIVGYNNVIYSIIPFTDTVFYSSPDHRFPQGFMPEEYEQVYYNSPPFYFYFPKDTSFCGIGDKYYICMDQCDISWLQSYRIEKSGVGLIHVNGFDGSQGATVTDSTLVYFVKNGVSRGTYVLPDTALPVTNYITNINEAADVNIYPNPASGQLSIETSISNYQLSLINVTGQVVYHRAACNSKQTIDVEGLANGVYNLKLETAEHEVINRKVVIQN